MGDAEAERGVKEGLKSAARPRPSRAPRTRRHRAKHHQYTRPSHCRCQLPCCSSPHLPSIWSYLKRTGERVSADYYMTVSAAAAARTTPIRPLEDRLPEAVPKHSFSTRIVFHNHFSGGERAVGLTVKVALVGVPGGGSRVRSVREGRPHSPNTARRGEARPEQLASGLHAQPSPATGCARTSVVWRLAPGSWLHQTAVPQLSRGAKGLTG